MEQGPALWKVLLVIGINLYISLQLAKIIFLVLLGPVPDPLMWADGSISW
tara:strand:+ start:445 stop:594 length:150 start_codon:yes stop_codon:yes gene_type:complete